jgi:divalent metal cation (Fe/Co/Zn/Cd) transporter
VPGVAGCYNIRSRGRPGDLFIEMVIIVAAESFHYAHQLTEQIERNLKEEFGRVAITIHFEPTRDHGNNRAQTDQIGNSRAARQP